MKRILFLLICLSPVCTIHAQETKDTIEHYLGFTGRVCEPQYARYYELAYRDGNFWKVKRFYLTTQTKAMEGYYEKYENDTFSVEQGMFLNYHRNGKVMQKVRYNNGLKEGVLKGYDSTGKLIDSGFYKKGVPYKIHYKWSDAGAVVFKGVYDTTGTGIGEEHEYYEDGSLSSYGKTGPNGLKDSIWTYYYINGRISSKETYVKDSMITMVCYNPDGTVSSKDCEIMIMPEPTFDIAKHLLENLHYPDDAKNNYIEGSITVQFVVTKSGELKDIKSIGKYVGGGCDEEAIRVVKIMPKWKPGKLHNRPMDIYYAQRISFRLE